MRNMERGITTREIEDSEDEYQSEQEEEEEDEFTTLTESDS